MGTVKTPGVTSSTRVLLAVAATVLLAAGVAVLVWGTDRALAGVLIRVGLIFGAAWLVAPLVKRPSLATLAFLAALGLVLIRPRLILAVVLGVVLWRLAGKRRREDS